METQISLSSFIYTKANKPNKPNISTSTAPPEPKKQEKVTVDTVPGLLLIKNYITQAEEDYLWQEVNKLPWTPFGYRKRMKFGYTHDPNVEGGMKQIGDVPDAFQFVISRLLEDKLLPKRPEQCCVNSYNPGQGINPHIDKTQDYGNGIAGLSLGSDTMMEYLGPKGEKVELFIPRRSMYVMQDAARYEWRHTIPWRKKDKLKDGTVNVRKARISLTFRTVELGFRKSKK